MNLRIESLGRAEQLDVRKRGKSGLFDIVSVTTQSLTEDSSEHGPWFEYAVSKSNFPDHSCERTRIKRIQPVLVRSSSESSVACRSARTVRALIWNPVRSLPVQIRGSQ